MYVILLAAMVFISLSLSGIFAPAFPEGVMDKDPENVYECCNTGSGAACRPDPNAPHINVNGKPYALLKTHTYPITEGRQSHQVDHFAPLKKIDNPDGVMFENVANKSLERDRSKECKQNGKNQEDWVHGNPDSGDDGEHVGQGCKAIPKHFLLYFCRQDRNPPGLCDKRVLEDPKVSVDIYVDYNKAKADGSGIPAVVSNCKRPNNPPPVDKKISFYLSPGGQPNLQLRTFKFIVEPPKMDWLSPYCKPAIYLYPEKKTEVNVSVYPQGEMLLTIPPYPKSGWDVIAEPDGDIFHQNIRFDYLYYEAAIPDQLIGKPREGFVMEYDQRALFLTNLVTKLGLNEKETKQFVEYWVPILPKANYYFVGVVPEKTLHEIAPVLITPKPNNLIRVTLYFQPLEQKIPVTPPVILSPARSGFTAVEWGGIFKQDKNHPFSCFM